MNNGVGNRVSLEIEISITQGINRELGIRCFQLTYIWCLLIDLDDKYLDFGYLSLTEGLELLLHSVSC